MQAAEAVAQATEAIRVLEVLDGITAEDHVDADGGGDVHASVALGAVAPSDPLVPSPWDRQLIAPIPGQVTPSEVKVDDG
jgi:hypothetical protein